MKMYRKSQIISPSSCLFLEETMLTTATVSIGSSSVLVAADRAKQSKIRAALRILSFALIGTKHAARGTQNENEI